VSFAIEKEKDFSAIIAKTTDFRILNTVIFTIKYRVSRGLVELLFM
jgi:hypothetical protein